MKLHFIGGFMIGHNLLAIAALLWMYFGAPPVEIVRLTTFWWWVLLVMYVAIGVVFLDKNEKRVSEVSNYVCPRWLSYAFRTSIWAQVPVLVIVGWPWTAVVVGVATLIMQIRCSKESA